MKNILDSVVFWLFMAVFTTTLMLSISSANAGEREREREREQQTINNIFKNDRFSEGFAKGVAATAITVCGIWPATKAYIWPATVGLFTASKPKFKKWVNCWEDTKPEPMPDPGPVLKDVIIDKPVGVKLYQ